MLLLGGVPAVVVPHWQVLGIENGPEWEGIASRLVPFHPTLMVELWEHLLHGLSKLAKCLLCFFVSGVVLFKGRHS